MILEYIFLNDSNLEKLKAYKYNYKVESKGKVTREINATISLNKTDKTNHWIMRIELIGKNPKESAMHLSKINEDLVQYNPIVLENESAAYFNRQLYPLVNSFERYLRQFLYLKTNLSGDLKSTKTLEGLEKMTFEQIYNLLFVDQKFCSAAQSFTANKKYSKKELIAKLQEFKETCLWDTIVEQNVLTMIKDDFLKLKDYRNDIMHAHNINYKTFNEAHTLFTKANIQLIAEINALSLHPDPNANSDLIVNALYNGIDLIHNGLENLKHIYSGFYDSINQLYNIQINQELKNALESLVRVIGIDQKALEESERKVKDDSDD